MHASASTSCSKLRPPASKWHGLPACHQRVRDCKPFLNMAISLRAPASFYSWALSSCARTRSRRPPAPHAPWHSINILIPATTTATSMLCRRLATANLTPLTLTVTPLITIPRKIFIFNLRPPGRSNFNGFNGFNAPPCRLSTPFNPFQHLLTLQRFNTLTPFRVTPHPPTLTPTPVPARPIYDVP